MHLYAFGSNGSGQLGIGHLDDVSRPQLCPISTMGAGSGRSSLPVKVTAGGNLTCVLFETGDIYRAGRGTISTEENKPWSSTKLEILSLTESYKIIMCSSTWDTTVLVNDLYEVYVQGSGPAGELSLGPQVKYCAEARKVSGFPPPGTKIIDIASSVSHTVVVLSNGVAWGWGNGRKGQLGEPAQVVWQARRIAGVEFEVVRAVCGREFTFLVGDHASDRHAILGSNKWGIKSDAPQQFCDWKDIAATWGTIFVLDNAGVIKSWGRQDRGQVAPLGLPPVDKIAAGSEHVLVLSKDGKVLVWGWGEHGNCGAKTDDEGNVSGVWNEISIEKLQLSTKALGIGAGCATSFVWCSNEYST